jgi:hypothetical protein
MPTMDFKDAHAVARKASKVAKRIGYACLGCALGMDDRGLARLGWHEAEADYEDAFSHAGPTLMTWSSGSLFDGATEIIDYILGDHAISDILDLESELRGYRDEFVLANHQLSDSPGERPDHVISMAHSWNAALALLKEAAIDTHDLEDSLIYHAIRVLIRSNGGASEMLARTNAIARLADECLILARAPDKIDHPNDGTGDDPLPEDGPHQNGWVLNGEIIDDPMHRKAWLMVDYLWNRRFRQCEFRDLAKPVYEDADHDTTPDAISSLRKKANAFLCKHKIEFHVTTRHVSTGHPVVKLEDGPPPASKK